MSSGSKVSEVCRQIGVTEQTIYRWRNEYGGIDAWWEQMIACAAALDELSGRQR
jgi:transposase-like protein